MRSALAILSATVLRSRLGIATPIGAENINHFKNMSDTVTNPVGAIDSANLEDKNKPRQSRGC